MALTGINLAWFRIFQDAECAKRSALIRRTKGIFGILCDDDRQALEYQYADARADHAAQHLTGSAIINAWSSNEGDTTAAENREWHRTNRDRKRKAYARLHPIWEGEE